MNIAYLIRDILRESLDQAFRWLLAPWALLTPRMQDIACLIACIFGAVGGCLVMQGLGYE